CSSSLTSAARSAMLAILRRPCSGARTPRRPHHTFAKIHLHRNDWRRRPRRPAVRYVADGTLPTTMLFGRHRIALRAMLRPVRISLRRTNLARQGPVCRRRVGRDIHVDRSLPPELGGGGDPPRVSRASCKACTPWLLAKLAPTAAVQ